MNTICHGLRTPNEAFFSSKSKTFGLWQTIWADTFWGFGGIFGQFISTHLAHLGTVSSLSMFFVNKLNFYKKLSLYIQILNIHLGLGFEFRLQRVRDLAIVCP